MTQKGGNSMRRCPHVILAVALVALLAAASATASVVINEIMYDSSFSPDIEYIELYNTGPVSQNLGDWYLLDNSLAHPKCYLVGTLGVGQYLVIAADTTLFRAQYPGVTNLNVKGFDPGGLGFGLGNSGDQVRLFDDDAHIRDSVAYLTSGDWPADAAGHGPSLELTNPFLDNSVGTNWLASVGTGGTPGVVNSRYAANALPVCDNGKRSVALPKASDAVTVTVRALDPENHLTGVALLVDLGSGFVSQPMYDDGAHGDGAAADSTFGAVIPAQTTGHLVKYYALATDILSQTNTWPDGAPTEYRAYTVGYVPPVLVVNELVADNTGGVFDDHGEREDWLEIYNPGTATVDLGGMYLTDNLGNENKWQIPPGISIGAGAHLVFWADADSLQGPMHAGFKFSASGEEAGIFSARDLGNTMISGWKFGPVGANVAVGYQPDYSGTSPAGVTYAPEYLAPPTPGASNATSAYYSPVCFNEFQTTSLAGGVDDWIELYNRGTSTYDLSGAFLSDNRSSNLKYKFPVGTTLAAGQFLVVNETTLGFSMSSSGELIVLTAADSISGLDFYDFKQEAPDTSEGRTPDGMGRWAKFPTPTPGASNTGALAVPAGLPGGPGLLSAVRAAPNPFGASTEIHFTLGQRQPVTAAVYDPAGRRVRVLHSGMLEPGRHALGWDGSQESGARAGAGVYFVRVSTAAATKTCLVILLK
jgi:hypothetical protein